MHELGINESDLEESFIRSGGPGGQNVNKVSTCVQLRHKPSGIVVKAQDDRSQAINRFLARRSLVEKIEQKLYGKSTSEQKKIEKIRKNKERRKRRARIKHQADS